MRIGKKGEDAGEEQTSTYFIAFELLVGALVLVGIGFFFVDSLPDDRSLIISRDLGLVIETVSSIPYDIYYAYPANTEEFRVVLSDQNYIDVYGSGPFSNYEYMLMPGIKTEEIEINSEVIIPVIKRDKNIYFSEQNIVQNIDSCSNEPLFLTKSPSVTFSTASGLSGSQRTFVNEVIVLIKSINRAQSNSLRLDDANADIKINLGFNKDNTLLIEYDESIQGQQRISCFLRTNLAKGATRFDSSEEKPASSNVINVYLGSYDKIKEQTNPNYESELKEAYALNLLAALKGGLGYG